MPIRIKGDQSKSGLEAERVFNAVQWITLHNRTGAALNVVIARALKGHQLNVTEWTVLNTLSEDRTGPYTVTKIAGLFDMNKPQATSLVGQLIKRSLVRQKVSARDRRVKHLSVTRTGKKLAYESEQSIQRAMRYWLFDLSDSELDEYIAIKKKVIEFDLPEINDI